MSVPCYLAKCPYYLNDDRNRIRCAGVHPVMSVGVNFSDLRSAKAWRKKYCQALDGHQECPIALTISFEQEVAEGEK